MRGIFGSSIPFLVRNHRDDFRRWTLRILFALAAATMPTQAHAIAVIFVTDAGTPTSSTCTLAQAIALANSGYGVDAASIGSATTDLGVCQFLPPPAPTPPPGPYTLFVGPTQITLTSIDNYWYGPNALPPIASAITIVPTGGILRLIASHTGDPTPATAEAFRFFYVSGGLEIQAGSLTLVNTILQGGYAKGGDAGSGGGGAGMGGAIFNQGSLSLNAVSLIGNTAQGGSSVTSIVTGGGGMGQDGISSGGGFGWASPPSGVGGKGGVGNGNGGGGGGGFIAGSDGGTGGVGTGGGKGGLGNAGPSAGDGGSAYTAATFSSCNGGDFGMGGVCFSGGGVGGGGGHAGGGGFGGGGGGSNVSTSGGFGGGGGYFFSAGGFGGGTGDGSAGGGGGGGLGGAIFNHRGSVGMVNVTATGNAANGGASPCATCGASGLGAVLFNLNGTVTIDFSTFAGNSLSGNNGGADNIGPEDGTVYSLAFGNKIEDGTASSATLKIHSSIIHGTHADGGQQMDVSVNVVNGAQTNSSSLIYAGKNLIGQSYTAPGTTQSGISPNTSPPLLGALSRYYSSPSALPVLPIGPNSPAYNAASSCLQADGSSPLTTDERGAARPNGSQCDIGAYEFDGDYIFADGVDVQL